MNALFDLFIENNIEFLRAPYLAWGQLCYMSDTEFVHGIMGDEELLMFEIPKVIFSIDWEGKSFEYVEKSNILTKERITSNQFVDAALLAGSYFFKGFSTPNPMQTSQKKEDRFKNELENIKGIRSASAILKMNNVRDDIAMQVFSSKNLIMHHPVLDFMTNTVVVLNKDALPRDFDEIVGERLPDEIYFLMCHGILSPQLVGNLVSGVFYEPTPLFDSQEYKDFITIWKPIYTSALNIFTSEMNDYFKNKPVTLYRHYATEDHHHQLSGDSVIIERKPANIFLDGLQFQINESLISKFCQQQKVTYNEDCTSLSFVLNLKPALLKKNQPQTFSTVNEAKSFIHLKVLETLGYVKKGNTADVLTSKGKLLASAKIYPEETLVLLELAKNNHLTASWNFERPFTEETKIANEEEILLISRVLSLVPLTFRRTSLAKSGWTGPIKLDLAIYYSIVKLLQSSIARLYESILTAVYMSHNLTQDNVAPVMNAMRSITTFGSVGNNTMGILAFVIMSMPIEKSYAQTNFKSMFLCCQNAYKDFVERAIPFWQQSYSILKKLGTDNKVLLTRLEKANELFEERIKAVATVLEQ